MSAIAGADPLLAVVATPVVAASTLSSCLLPGPPFTMSIFAVDSSRTGLGGLLLRRSRLRSWSVRATRRIGKPIPPLAMAMATAAGNEALPLSLSLSPLQLLPLLPLPLPSLPLPLPRAYDAAAPPPLA